MIKPSEKSIHAVQAKSGLAMPVSRVKSDVKSISGCKSMSVDASVYFAAVLEFVIGDMTKHGQSKSRRKSIAPRDIREHLCNNSNGYANIIGKRPVFIEAKSASRKRTKIVKQEVVTIDVVEPIVAGDN